MGGLNFSKEPSPPGDGYGRYTLAVVLFMLLMLAICLLSKLNVFG